MSHHSTAYRTLPLREMIHSDEETDINSLGPGSLCVLAKTSQDHCTRETALMILRKAYQVTPEPMIVRR